MKLEVDSAQKLATPATNSSPDVIIKKSDTLNREEVLLYEKKARRAIMWLSGYMKHWLSDGYLGLERQGVVPLSREDHLKIVTQRVKEQSPALEFKKLMELLDVFVEVTELTKIEDSVKQLEVLSRLQAAKKVVDALHETDSFNEFLSLPDNQELFDEAEMQQLIREFRHDLKNAGESAMDTEYDLVLKSPFTERYQHVSHIWGTIKSMFDTSLTQPTARYVAAIQERNIKERPLDDEAIAGVLFDIYDTLAAFNLEEGGVVEEPAKVSTLKDYLNRKQNDWLKQFPNLAVNVTFEIDDGALDKMTTLNIPTLSRLLTNALTNTDRALPKDFQPSPKTQDSQPDPTARNYVSVVMKISNESALISINDNGTGFPIKKIDDQGNAIKSDPRVLLGKNIDPYSIEFGKTHWESTKGTGTGLYGMQRMIRGHLKGDLIAGNRYNGAKLEGATLAAIVPVFQEGSDPTPVF